VSPLFLINAANVLAIISWATFVVAYHVRATWWDNVYGRNMMILANVISFTMMLALISRNLPSLHYPTFVAVLVFLSFAALGVQNILVMTRAQNRQRKIRELESDNTALQKEVDEL
jgi:hypothetical protein